MKLKSKLKEKIDAWRPRTTKLLKEHGDVKISDVTIAQAIGGVRGVKCLVTDISYLDPHEGIRFRGHTIPETLEALPKPEGAEMPYVEGLVWLLLTGDFPKKEEALELVEEFKKRSKTPKYVFDMLKAMPKDSHPMAMFSAAIVAMQRESAFVKAYNEGVSKMEYWEPTLEDALNLWAKLPQIAAFIYRWKYKNGDIIDPNPKLDMGANFAHMMGIDNPEYYELMRLYLVLHSDHEGGNVSAHTTHLVGSALSDAYYSLAAGMNGLAGPLHGLANQEVLRWIQNLMQKLGGKVPSKDQLSKALWDTLNSGQVVPGYGHAVLRQTDPRYTAQREFALKHMPDDDLFRLVSLIYETAPDILKEHGKAKNPWPNVDAHSGVLQWFYGVREYDFYTVLFGVSRAMGVLAQLIWDRALGLAIERPKSLTTETIKKMIAEM
jgi:citrate synthase